MTSGESIFLEGSHWLLGVSDLGVIDRGSYSLLYDSSTVVRVQQKPAHTVEMSGNGLTKHIKLKHFHPSFQFC